IAAATKIDAFTTTAIEYATSLITFWKTYSPDVATATGILRNLEHPQWARLRALHETIKRAMLDALSLYPSAEDLAGIATYAQGSARWQDDDQRRLKRKFADYRDGNFSTELGEADDED